jgi:hypothetical protein
LVAPPGRHGLTRKCLRNQLSRLKILRIIISLAVLGCESSEYRTNVNRSAKCCLSIGSSPHHVRTHSHDVDPPESPGFRIPFSLIPHSTLEKRCAVRSPFLTSNRNSIQCLHIRSCTVHQKNLCPVCSVTAHSLCFHKQINIHQKTLNSISGCRFQAPRGRSQCVDSALMSKGHRCTNSDVLCKRMIGRKNDND